MRGYLERFTTSTFASKWMIIHFIESIELYVGGPYFTERVR